MATIYTVGHGARTAEELVSILKESKIQTLVDVRAFPSSRRHPQFSRKPLSATALTSLRERVCIMCAESNPAECHRSLIADWLVAHGQRVVHLLGEGRLSEHALNPAVRMEAGRLVYAGAQQRLL